MTIAPDLAMYAANAFGRLPLGRVTSDFSRIIAREAGIDLRPDLRQILRMFQPSLAADLDRLDLLFCPSSPSDPSDREDEISRLYRSVRLLAGSGNEVEYQRSLARLSELENREVQRMQAYFATRRQLDPEALRQEIREAEQILRKHAPPAAPDPSARVAD